MRWKSAALSTLAFASVFLFAGIVWAADERQGEFWFYWTNGWKIANFLILIFLLVRIAKEPLKNLLADRYTDIESAVNEAEKVNQESEEEFAQVELKMAELGANVDQLAQLIESQGNTQKERIIQDAQALSKTIIEDAKNRSMHELRIARQKLKEELVDMAFAKAEEMIKKKITDKDRDSIVTDYISKIAAAA